MEANKNNELEQQWWYKSTVTSMYNNIASIAISISTLHDIKQDDMPTPIINFFYSLLSSSVVNKEDLNYILDDINKNLRSSEPMTDKIRMEMNI